jgi:hypothetical protein
MPVADEGQDQDHRCDYQQAGRFQGADLWRMVMLRGRRLLRMWIQLSFWTRSQHTTIVAPENDGIPSKIELGDSPGTSEAGAAYHRLMWERACARSASGDNL